ncbi:MAG: pyrroline-5-carboxylate reductase [Terriglobales bacterium]
MASGQAAGSIAVLGCGKIGEALVRGMLESGFATPPQITASARRPERAAYLEQTFRIRAGTANASAAAGAAVVVLALKPNLVLPVLEEIRGALAPEALVISVAAAISLSQMEQCAGGRVAIIRAMPNTPALIRRSMTALACGQGVNERQMAAAVGLFQSVGRVVTVEERHLDAVTGLSASGPAFVYMVIEAMAEGGVRAGLPRDLALELAAQTVVGAGAMVLDTGEHPAKLKDNVTTPAGCTVDGLLELEAGGLRVALIKAVSRAAKRAGELGSK